MTPAQRRYVAIEAMIGAMISAVLSIVFVLLMFGRLDRVPVMGGGGLIVDGVPQGFAIALMATLVPTMLTRRRLALQRVAPIIGDAPRRSVGFFVQLLAIAMMGAGLTVAMTALLPVVGVDDVALMIVLAAKAVWGFVLGGVIAAIMTRAALAADGIWHRT